MYKLTNHTSCIRLADNASIPNDTKLDTEADALRAELAVTAAFV